MGIEGFYIGVGMALFMIIIGTVAYKFPKFSFNYLSQTYSKGKFDKDAKYGERAGGILTIFFGAVLLIAELIAYFVTYY